MWVSRFNWRKLIGMNNQSQTTQWLDLVFEWIYMYKSKVTLLSLPWGHWAKKSSEISWGCGSNMAETHSKLNTHMITRISFGYPWIVRMNRCEFGNICENVGTRVSVFDHLIIDMYVVYEITYKAMPRRGGNCTEKCVNELLRKCLV